MTAKEMRIQKSRIPAFFTPFLMLGVAQFFAFFAVTYSP